MMMREPRPAGAGETRCCTPHSRPGGRPRRRCPRALCAGAAATLAALVAEGMARGDPPPAVEITPNAIEKPREPMEIAIQGAPRQTLYLFILRNCDNDWNTPEIIPRGGCDPRILSRPIELDDRGHWNERKLMTAVPASLYGQKLWIRVSPNPDGRWPYGDAMFTMVSEPCSVWDTVVELFSDDRCQADIQKTLRPQMGGSDERPAVAMEVRRLVRDPATGAWSKPERVPGTRGATGVAWADAQTLLVTVGRVEEDAAAAVDELPRAARPGLYRMDAASGKGELLLSAGDEEILAAPFAVRTDYIVFVRERVVAGRDGTVATLAVRSRGRILREIPLRRTVHQILAADAGKRSVLAYSRWHGVPALLRIDLRTGAVTHLGLAEQLFHAVMRAPGGSQAAVALEDNAGYNGWDLILVDEKGHLAEELAVGPGEDLMPAWRPERMELVYLGQAERAKEGP
jgi:hypothetical protein